MKFNRTGVAALFMFFTMQGVYQAWAQNAPSFTNPQHTLLNLGPQPAQILFLPPQLTNFERYASSTDQPLVHVAFPAISVDFGPHISLSLTPRGLTPFDAPGALKALAVEFKLTQSLPVARNTQFSQSHSVATLLDFDELLVFRSVFHALAVTGMPQPPFSDASAVVRMTSKSGMNLEFKADEGGRIRCVVSTDADSVVFLLDTDSATKWADAFTAAFRTLDAARDSRT